MTQHEAIIGLVLLGAAVILAIWGRISGRLLVHYTAKPAATSILLICAVISIAPSDSKPWALGALTFSLIGDILLMLGSRYFIPGLFAFLAALGSYALCFITIHPYQHSQWLYFILPLSAGVWILNSMWPQLPNRMKWPLGLYALMMSFFVWRSLCLFDSLTLSLSAWGMVCGGCICFMLGDTWLAYRLFLDKKVAYHYELGCYYTAQYLIVVGLSL
jgi:uncharacterized membrane protein YhhN